MLYKEIGALSLNKRRAPAGMWAVTQVHGTVGEMRNPWWAATGRRRRKHGWRKRKEEKKEQRSERAPTEGGERIIREKEETKQSTLTQIQRPHAGVSPPSPPESMTETFLYGIRAGDIVVRMSGAAEDSDFLIQKALKGSIFMLGNRCVNVTLRSTALIESRYLWSTDGSTSTVWILVSCRVFHQII